MAKVSELIKGRSEVFFVREDDTVHHAARYLREKQVRAVGVCNADGKLVGVISQSDISDKVAAEHRCPSWVKVAEIMSTRLVQVTPEASLDQCINLMEQHGIYHLLVMDEGNSFRGMISMQDVLKAIAADQKSRAEILEAYIFPNR